MGTDETHETASPLNVWEHLADGLNNEMHQKTVVLSMKIYDIAHLIIHGEYLKFPREIPIPCDLQVERVSRTVGVINTEDTGKILDAWAEVMDETSENLSKHTSLLRIDSIIWQAGQIIGENEPDREAAITSLVEHFRDVGIGNSGSRRLAKELTAAM